MYTVRKVPFMLANNNKAILVILVVHSLSKPTLYVSNKFLIIYILMMVFHVYFNISEK